jgi:folate-binding protein YgfZ
VFFCTSTARVVAHGHVWRSQPDEGKLEDLWLDLDPGLGQKAYQHLDRYLISEDVTLTDHTDKITRLHLTGPTMKDVLGAVGVEISGWQRNTFLTAGPVTECCLERLGQPGCDLLCPVEQGTILSQRLTQAGAVPASHETFEVLRVESGTPLYGLDMNDNTFAPEVGRTLEAISYTKGCYLGQEPIVMARDRGVVQRGLVGLLTGETLLQAGSVLYRGDQEVGRSTSSVYSPRLAQSVALAYVKRGSQAPGTSLGADVVGGTRRSVTVAKLPFVT